MSAFADELIGTAKSYLGPAASVFMTRQLKALNLTIESVGPQHVATIADRVARSAAKLMQPDLIVEFVDALKALAAKAEVSREDERSVRLTYLRRAVVSTPLDLASHRQLAASLANGGDVAGAVAEYQRFVDALVGAGDAKRALIEVAYALNVLGERDEIMALAQRLAPAPAPSPTPTSSAPIPMAPVVAVPRQPSTSMPSTPEPVVNLGLARRLIDEGKLNAASDLLLDWVASGTHDREPQRLLVEVNRRAGREQIAREKSVLLAAVAQLDAPMIVSTEVQLAPAVS